MSIRAAAPALAAALLFSASTPLAKVLTGDISPLLLAGLLYLGSGFGLGAVLLFRRLRATGSDQPDASVKIPRAAELPWLLGAIVAGGMLGPALLMLGLEKTDASSATLLLSDAERRAVRLRLRVVQLNNLLQRRPRHHRSISSRNSRLRVLLVDRFSPSPICGSPSPRSRASVGCG